MSTLTKLTELDCCICRYPIPAEPNGWTQGHNAFPVKEGRCCEHCNNEHVIPARIRKWRYEDMTTREQLNHGDRIEQFVNEVVQTYIENGGTDIALNEIADRIELSPYETHKVATAVFRSEGWSRVVPTGSPAIEYRPTPAFLTQTIKSLRNLSWSLAEKHSTPEGLKESIDEIFKGLRSRKTLKVNSVC